MLLDHFKENLITCGLCHGKWGAAPLCAVDDRCDRDQILGGYSQRRQSNARIARGPCLREAVASIRCRLDLIRDLVVAARAPAELNAVVIDRRDEEIGGCLGS